MSSISEILSSEGYDFKDYKYDLIQNKKQEYIKLISQDLSLDSFHFLFEKCSKDLSSDFLNCFKSKDLLKAFTTDSTFKDLQAQFARAVKLHDHKDTLGPDPLTAVYVESKVSSSDEFSKLFNEVCEELKALDPHQIENFCTLQETHHDPKTLGIEIQQHNRRDPLCRLIRADAVRTYQLLKTNSAFRKLVHRTALFNTSRDAAMRLKTLTRTGTSISPEFLELFKQFKDVFQNYISKTEEVYDDLFVFEVQRLYMTLLTFNYFPDRKEGDPLYRAITSTTHPQSLADCIKSMRELEARNFGYKAVIRYSQSHRFFFIPTYAPVSIKTLINAWASGIFFFGCTSKKKEVVDSFPSDPKFGFVHDELHFMFNIEQIPYDDLDTLYPQIQANAKKIITHKDELLKSQDPQKKELGTALEYVLFVLHHEGALLFLRNDVLWNGLSVIKRHRHLSFESSKHVPPEIKKAAVYYEEFAEKNFS